MTDVRMRSFPVVLTCQLSEETWARDSGDGCVAASIIREGLLVRRSHASEQTRDSPLRPIENLRPFLMKA